MKVKITSQERNELLKRVEVVAEITNEGATPARTVLQEKIAILADGTPELTVVDKISTSFGNANGTVSAFIYDTEKDKVDASAKYVVEKNKYEPPKAAEPEPAKEEPKAEEAAPEAEAPEAEAPAEEAKVEEPEAKKED